MVYVKMVSSIFKLLLLLFCFILFASSSQSGIKQNTLDMQRLCCEKVFYQSYM